MISIYLYIEITLHCNSKKEVVTVFDLGYRSIEKDFPEQSYHHYLTEKKEEKPKRVIPRKIRKKTNKNHSKKRIAIEHTFAG
jgi:hypothetical protein